jgi:RNA polymerase sigma-32 factor
MLEPAEEYMLAKRWQEHSDSDAAHRLVTSHLRLVTRIAMGYRGYGLPIGEVISEGNVGLMQAVKRFEPDKGFRLATYAMWWIRASIQEYILRSWSLVKMGTTRAQKKLFFNLRRMKGQIKALGRRRPAPRPGQAHRHQARRARGGRDLHEPAAGRRRLAECAGACRCGRRRRVAGLAGRRHAGPGGAARRIRGAGQRRAFLASALSTLNDREKRIFEARRLAEEPATLEDLSAEFGVSRERIRQIEVRAFEKVQLAVQKGRQALRGARSAAVH